MERSSKSSLAAAAFVLLCGAWYGQRCWAMQMPDRGPSDFQFYYHAAQHVWHGESPYLEGGYVYSPLLALLLAPLAAFDYFAARWIWFVVSHAAFLGAGFLLWRHLGRGRAAMCSVALVWAAGGAAEDGFGLGQVDAVLLLLAVVAITRNGVARMACVAGGFALKFFSGILVLLERRWRGFVATAALATALLVGPWTVVRYGLKGPAAPASASFLSGTPCVLSWSLPSVAVRFADWPGAGKLPADWTFGYDLPKLRLKELQRSISGGLAELLLLIGWLVWRRAGVKDDVVAGTALLCLAVAASPISWWHYPVMEYPAIAILLSSAVRLRRVGLAVGTVATGVGCYLAPAAVLKYYFHQHERWPDYPWLIQFWTAVPAVSALILFGLLLYRLRDARTAHVE
jgi:Glycosyltransferase family 87